MGATRRTQKLNNKKRKRKIKVEGGLVNMGGMWMVVNRGNYDDYEDGFTLADWMKQYKEKKHIQYKLSKSDEEDEEENIQRRPPVETKCFSYSKVVGEIPQNEPESDEEVLGDADYYDCDINGCLNFVVKKRVETDRGGKYVVERRWMTETNPEVPEKFYISRKVLRAKGRRSRVTSSVLHDPGYPVAAVSKLALKTYNTIQLACVAKIPSIFKLKHSWEFDEEKQMFFLYKFTLSTLCPQADASHCAPSSLLFFRRGLVYPVYYLSVYLSI